jgi:riboflavin synthase
MFTGIIETMGKIISVKEKETNKIFTVSSSISSSLKIDQSVAHNGVCLTVIELGDGTHKVEAIAETLSRTNLGSWKENTSVNLERSLLASSRIDGHFVQGHADNTVKLLDINDQKGSWIFTFSIEKKDRFLVVEKGSVAVNGVSLTVADVKKKEFSVAIIPYTYEHTNFNSLKVGEKINVEFDILGKYINRRKELE